MLSALGSFFIFCKTNMKLDFSKCIISYVLHRLNDYKYNTVSKRAYNPF